MKKFLFAASALLLGSLASNAQSRSSYYSTYPSYSNSNSVYSTGSGYNASQSYGSSRGYTNVQTSRSYDGWGGYNSNTQVYRNGQLSSSSFTTSSPYGGTTTYRNKY